MIEIFFGIVLLLGGGMCGLWGAAVDDVDPYIAECKYESNATYNFTGNVLYGRWQPVENADIEIYYYAYEPKEKKPKRRDCKTKIDYRYAKKGFRRDMLLGKTKTSKYGEFAMNLPINYSNFGSRIIAIVNDDKNNITSVDISKEYYEGLLNCMPLSNKKIYLKAPESPKTNPPSRSEDHPL